MSDDGLRDPLLQLSPTAPDHLRTVLIRDETAQLLLCYGDANGNGWADVIDTLTMCPDVRRQAVRLLAEIDASGLPTDERSEERHATDLSPVLGLVVRPRVIGPPYSDRTWDSIAA